MRSLYFIGVIGFLMSLSLHAEDLGVLPPDQGKLKFEELVVKWMSIRKTPGAAVAVTFKGQPVYVRAFGYKDQEKTQTLDEHSIFRLASISKVLTSFAIFQLWEKGAIDLETPIVQYLPWFRQDDPSERWKLITVSHLLSHRSGISREAGSDIWNNLEVLKKGVLPSSADMLTAALGQPMIYDPGKESHYSNLGYWLLGHIVAEKGGATGASADERYLNYMTEYVLKPLQMTKSGFKLDRSAARQMAQPYGLLVTKDKRLELPLVFDTGGSASAWGFYSTAADITKLLIMISQMHALQANPIMKKETAEKVQPLIHSLDVFGLQEWGRESVYHAGWFPGYHSQITAWNDYGIAVFTNNVQGASNDISGLAENLIVYPLLGKKSEVYDSMEPSKTDAEVLAFSDKLNPEWKEQSVQAMKPRCNIIGVYKNLFRRFWVTIGYFHATGLAFVASDGRPWNAPGPLRGPKFTSKAYEDFFLPDKGGLPDWRGETLRFMKNPDGKIDHVLIANSTRFTPIGVPDLIQPIYKEACEPVSDQPLDAVLTGI